MSFLIFFSIQGNLKKMFVGITHPLQVQKIEIRFKIKLEYSFK